VLGYVDPYGDTILNELQQQAAVADLDELAAFVASDKERTIWGLIRSLVETCLIQTHHYVWMIGD
jgi:hypothetical protein